jgi:hypothetical protein
MKPVQLARERQQLLALPLAVAHLFLGVRFLLAPAAAHAWHTPFLPPLYAALALLLLGTLLLCRRVPFLPCALLWAAPAWLSLFLYAGSGPGDGLPWLLFALVASAVAVYLGSPAYLTLTFLGDSLITIFFAPLDARFALSVLFVYLVGLLAALLRALLPTRLPRDLRPVLLLTHALGALLLVLAVF